MLDTKWMLIPLFAQFLLSISIYGVSRLRRVEAVKKGKVKGQYSKTFEGEKPPREVLAVDQLILNLFEMPVLFYTISLIIINLKLNDTAQMIFASLYVLSRIWHVKIKIQNGSLSQRALVFTISALLLSCMWFWVMIKTFLF